MAMVRVVLTLSLVCASSCAQNPVLYRWVAMDTPLMREAEITVIRTGAGMQRTFTLRSCRDVYYETGDTGEHFTECRCTRRPFPGHPDAEYWITPHPHAPEQTIVCQQVIPRDSRVAR